MFSQDKCITLEKFFATLLCLFCFFKMTFCPCLLLAANSIQGEGEGEARGDNLDSIDQQQGSSNCLPSENLTGVALVMQQRINRSTGHKRCLIFKGYA